MSCSSSILYYSRQMWFWCGSFLFISCRYWLFNVIYPNISSMYCFILWSVVEDPIHLWHWILPTVNFLLHTCWKRILIWLCVTFIKIVTLSHLMFCYCFTKLNSSIFQIIHLQYLSPTYVLVVMTVSFYQWYQSCSSHYSASILLIYILYIYMLLQPYKWPVPTDIHNVSFSHNGTCRTHVGSVDGISRESSQIRIKYLVAICFDPMPWSINLFGAETGIFRDNTANITDAQAQGGGGGGGGGSPHEVVVLPLWEFPL